MSTTSIEEFPYTIGYVSQLLETTEEQVLHICNQRGVPMHTDPTTGRVFFSLKSLEQLRQLMENQKRTEPRSESSTQLAKSPTSPARSTMSTAPVPAMDRNQRSMPQFADSAEDDLSRGDISQIVETVSNAKESILQDLSMLLDDRLSGLDELVVELIRSKRENDRLKKELKKLEETVANYQSELTKYKPAAFGFFRKVQ